MSKEWFELSDARKRLFARAAWIPVYGTDYPEKASVYPEIGFIEEVLAVGSAAIYANKRKEAEELDWHYWRPDNMLPYLHDDGRYVEAQTFHDEKDGPLGFHLVLSNYINSMHPRQVFLNQDFTLAYGLIEEGNAWLRPSEGYEEVVRLRRDMGKSW